MVGVDGSCISCVTAVELGMRGTLVPLLGMMPSSVSAVPLGGCEPPLGGTISCDEVELGELELMLDGCELRLDGCELRLDGCELRLDGTGSTPGRGGRELRDFVGPAAELLPDPSRDEVSPPGSKSPRRR